MSATDQTPEVRQSIIDATEQLLEEHTLDQLTVGQICKQAKTSRATFYFYFASKDDAFRALLDTVMDEALPSWLAMIEDPARRRTSLRSDLAAWLADGPAAHPVLKAVIEEWPRSEELRERFLASHAKMTESLATAIEADRAAGIAAPGIPADQLAAGFIWMMERTWYEAVSGADHLSDQPAVFDALGATLSAAIYGA